MVPLPKKLDAKPIGESRSQAVRRFLSLERSLNSKAQFREVNTVMQEYFDLGHAEPVPVEDLSRDPSKVFYLPMHAAYKDSSTTTKVRVVFDASAKSVVLGWLTGNPRRFKTYVGNRVSSIVDQIPPDRWNHVISNENSADCASRGLPSELLEHKLWWEGPPWLLLMPPHWPKRPNVSMEQPPEEERKICLVTTTLQLGQPIVPIRLFPASNV